MSVAALPQTAPHDPTAESSMLGACLIAEKARLELAKNLDPMDFYVHRNQLIAAAIMELHRRASAVDLTTVAGWLDARKELEAAGGIPTLAKYLGDCPASSAAVSYAAIIRDRAARRRVMMLLIEQRQAVEDLTVDVGDTAENIRAGLHLIDNPSMDEAEASPNIEEFLAHRLEYNWLVPGLLEAGDRMLLTSVEGGGKSTFLHQLALQFAAGIHPFKARTSFAPVRVLDIDLENSEMQMNRRYAQLMKILKPDAHQPQLGAGVGFNPDMLRIEARPQGVDLLRREGRRWFTSRVEKAEPDVVITGSLYKMHDGDENANEVAAQLAGYLDELRSVYRCALIIEAHSPHGDEKSGRRSLRPIGSSLWRRWPEFGYGIRKDGSEDKLMYDLEEWRPPRDDTRDWPKKLRRTTRGWPWQNGHGPNPDADHQPGPGSPGRPALRAVANLPPEDEPF